jgi:hypothetical protein
MPGEGTVQYPAHPRVKQKPDDHYKILQHAAGQIDLEATEEGRQVLLRYKADADHAAYGGPKPPRIPEVGEAPPSHLTAEEREKWLERQRTQALLDGE